MLHLIPAGLHRAGLRAAHQIRKRYWWLVRPALNGVLAIAQDGEGRVLLVRHTYGRGHCALPGGGIRKGEDPLATVQRECAEEVGCMLEAPVFLGLHRTTLHGAPVERHVFAGMLGGVPRPDGREVAEARFFARDSLPPDCGAVVADVLGMLGESR